MNQLGPTVIFGTLQPPTANYILYSNAHETCTKRDHIMDCKSNLNILKRSEITYSMFTDHNRSKLEVIYRNTPRKSPKYLQDQPHTSK